MIFFCIIYINPKYLHACNRKAVICISILRHIAMGSLQFSTNLNILKISKLHLNFNIWAPHTRRKHESFKQTFVSTFNFFFRNENSWIVVVVVVFDVCGLFALWSFIVFGFLLFSFYILFDSFLFYLAMQTNTFPPTNWCVVKQTDKLQNCQCIVENKWKIIINICETVASVSC